MIPPARTTKQIQWFSITALTFVISGCSTMPSFGPSSAAINNAAVEVVADAEDVLPFRIIDVSTSTLPSVEAAARSFPATFRRQGFRTSDETIQVADMLEIKIWEVAEDGLFASAGRKETVLQASVTNSGYITLPYANTIAVTGLTTAQLREQLLERYKGQAVEPEIVVQISETQSRNVTVLGAIRTPGSALIPSKGVRLLDLLAQAGGTSQPAWEVSITVQRATASATLSLSDVLDSSSNNIIVFPGDIVSVAHVPRRFAVYGAIARPGNIEIPTAAAHLADLLAEVGGLNDKVSEARSVFVFRPPASSDNSGTSPAIAYRFDFSRPDAFLLAGLFKLQPTDITYIASADAADFQKFVTIFLSPLLGTATRASSIGN